MTAAADFARQFTAEAEQLDLEITEIDMLVTQARSEAARHETRRAAAADKLAKLADGATAKEAIDLAGQVATLTRRAALMEAQLEILEGKKRSIARLRETIQAHAAAVGGLAGAGGPTGAVGEGPGPVGGTGPAGGTAVDETVIPPAVSRIVLNAQEDLRREIARAMHDGPAQSLTNIVLQAEIVERLLDRDPKMAVAEVHQLVAMVQQTLEATKTFIFDVRPMVLDDLGLVPTLRRAARDRGRRAGIAVEFESAGGDRRLSVELESGLFRIVDEALASYLAARPERVAISLDWGDALIVTVRAGRTAATVTPLGIPEGGEALPPALAAMVEDRREGHRVAIEAARRSAIVKLPARLSRDLLDRAAMLSIAADITDDGGIRLRLELPPAA